MTLKTAEKKHFGLIKSLYKTAFPKDERAPFFFIKRRYLQGRADLLAAFDGDKFTGFCYIVCHGDFAYLFYLAVEENLRGKGTGSGIISLVKEKYAGKTIFLAREPLDKDAENYGQRVSRRAFYLKNGFEDTGLQLKEAGVVYDVMTIGGGITAKDYETLIRFWAGDFVMRLADMRIVEKTAHPESEKFNRNGRTEIK